MTRKKTHGEFLEEVKALVGEEYEVIGKYVKSSEKVEMKHKVCVYEYEVTPNSFLRGIRCPKCSGKMKKTTEQYKKEVYDLVGDEYEILGEYKNSHTKILFKHNECSHEYEATPSSFLQGRRCPKCAGRCRTTESFKQEIYNLVGDEYEVLGEYINNQKKIKMKHNECGYEYGVRSNDFLNGKRCPKCAGLAKKTTEGFRQEVCNIVGNEYIVLGEYINNQKKIKMKHNECGCVYRVQPRAFLMGTRCPKCASSKGEKRVSDFLKLQKKSFQEQYRFDDCRYKKHLPFDFAIFNPDNTINCLIEYDGKQHYESIEHWGGEKGFKQRQHNDQIKNQYCKDNNIKLIRIPYWDFDNIKGILNEELKEVIGSEVCTQQAS